MISFLKGNLIFEFYLKIDKGGLNVVECENYFAA